MIHLGDITKIDWATVPPVDCVTGGSPCQDLSVAGKRAGLAGERSGLYMEQIRCVKELRKADEQRGRAAQFIRPRYMVWENVPGAFSSNKGKDFAAVLEEAVKVIEPEAPAIPVPEGGWPYAGCLTDGVAGKWSIAWRVHDAQFWGVPQRRRRISLVCDFGGLSAPEILFERKGSNWDSEQSGAPGEEAAGGTGKSIESASGAFNPWDSQSARVYSQDGVWHSLNANENGGQSRDAVFCLQGNTIDRDAKQNGSGISVGVAHTLNGVDRHGIAIPINTMVATKTDPETRTTFGVGEDGDAQFTISSTHSHAVCAGFSFGQSEKARTIGYQEEVSPTLRGGEGGNQKPCVYDARGNGDGKTVCTITGDHESRVTDYTALCIGNGQANQSVDTVVGALNTMHDQQAVMVLNDQGGDVMDVSNENTKTLRTQSHGHEPAVMSQTVVRRLTPLEAERLQGYPDGWTDIGEWVDSKGKKHKPADSPRYKALGNSIALPFWFWLLRRISAQYYGPATLGSLFDGIGGFPLCWERCNGKGTALWASEIEEFPIAVTKKYFESAPDALRER